MSRTLLILAVAAFAFMLVGVIAAVLKVTAFLALAALGGVAIVSVAVYLLVKAAGRQPAAS